MQRFKLVTLDLDGTLLPHDMAFAAILRASGHAALAEEASRKFASGEWTLPQTYDVQWRVVQTLSLADMHRALRAAPWLPGIAEGVRQLRDAGAQVCVLTDVASTVTDFLGRWGLTDALCSPVTVKDGRQVALDRRLDKLANLQDRLASSPGSGLVGAGVPASAVCHVGNGANDIPVFQAAGGSVGVFAPPEVAGHARTVVPSPASMQDVVDAVLALDARTA